jgi:hypothetical protein
LRSNIGPKTKNANREPLVKVAAKDKAKKESTVEQMEIVAANNIITKIEITGP